MLTSGQPNILVDHAGCPQITEFGSAMVVHDTNSSQHAPDEKFHYSSWTAPEIVTKEWPYSKAVDVFSFAMVMSEVRC